MAATITLTIPPLWLPLVGVDGIDVLVDGEPAASLQFGETVEVSVPAGPHHIQTLLRAVIQRRSSAFVVELHEGQTLSLIAKYSRMSGNFRLREG